MSVLTAFPVFVLILSSRLVGVTAVLVIPLSSGRLESSWFYSMFLVFVERRVQMVAHVLMDLLVVGTHCR